MYTNGILMYFFFHSIRMGHVEKANEVLAIETLLVSDELFRSVAISIFLFKNWKRILLNIHVLHMTMQST